MNTNSATISPFARPLFVMLKPVGAHCNLACKYCYYLEKGGLYKDEPRHIMSDALLERFTREYIQSQTTPQVTFSWHGGETFMRPLSFYKKALAFQRKYADGRIIENSIQTNGTLLTDEWCRFFKENNWLVGVSIDGPQEVHDAYRQDKLGRPSWRRVMAGIRLLQKHGVEWNAMAVVNHLNAEKPLETYRFFKEIGARFIQFTPVVERMMETPDGNRLAHLSDVGEATLASFSVTPTQWGHFLCTLFDEWVRQDVGQYYVQLFDATLANWCGLPPGICTLGKDCGHAAVMEFNGDVYSCDHFVFPEYLLGNIRRHTLMEMLYSKRQREFGQMKLPALPRQCRECCFLFACHGECPKNRFAKTADGETGLNYLCEGYMRFFRHVKPYMDFMRDEFKAGRAPANVMEAIKEKKLRV